MGTFCCSQGFLALVAGSKGAFSSFTVTAQITVESLPGGVGSPCLPVWPSVCYLGRGPHLTFQELSGNSNNSWFPEVWFLTDESGFPGAGGFGNAQRDVVSVSLYLFTQQLWLQHICKLGKTLQGARSIAHFMDLLCTVVYCWEKKWNWLLLYCSILCLIKLWIRACMYFVCVCYWQLLRCI